MGGEALPLGGARQRCLLALLLLHANETVSRDRLIEGVWGARRPSTIAAALNVHLSKIRKLLAAAGIEGALVTAPHGYVLEIDPERIDVHRFERLLREGRRALLEGEAGQAAAALDEALSLWRGPPLAGLELDASVDAAVRRLCELRLSGLEGRFEAKLELGRHSEAVPELEEFVREHPLHERARAQLMLALYRSGRSADALETFREARRQLAGELGLDPGPELRRLERAILEHDPSLGGPRARSRPRVARRLVAAGVALAATAALLMLGPTGPGDEPERLESVVFARASDVAIVQPETHKVVARVPVGSSPTLVREGDGSVWVADRLDLTVTEIDPESRSVLRTIGLGFRPDDIAARNGAVWAFDKEGSVLARLGDGQTWDRFEDPDFGGVEQMEVDENAVWLAGGRRLIRVDADTGNVLSRASVPVAVDGLALGGDDVWAVSASGAAVLRIDRHTSVIRDRIPIGSRTGGTRSVAISAAGGLVWVLNGDTATVTKIDPELHDVVETYRLGIVGGSLALAAGEGAAWISNAFDGTVTRIDAVTSEVASIRVSAYYRPNGLTVAGGLVWVTVDDDRA